MMSIEGVGFQVGRGISHVRRRGNVVTRVAGPWTPTIHALLRHLHAAGLLVPEPFGVEADREVLRFVLGDVPAYPYGDDVWTDASLTAAATLLRKLHDATAMFSARNEQWPLPPNEPREVICHNDLAPYNTVFRNGLPVGAIDWDTAAPGPRVRDVAYVAFRWVPLQAPGHGNGPTDPADRMRRLRLFLETYRSDLDAEKMIGEVLERVRDLYAFTADRVEQGNPRVAERLRDYEADIAYLEAGGPPV
ncbi:MAG: hypothetical protein QOI42_593 [Frankiaceae bacterium]|nr:hypothetical protein [Frankiaceae bacterium]